MGKNRTSDSNNKYDTFRKRLFQIIQIGYTDDFVSKTFDIFIAAVIIINLFVVFFVTFDESAKYKAILDNVELISIIIFTVEYVLRLWTADYLYPGEKSKIKAILHFVFSLYGIIDLASFLPYYLPVVFPAGIVAFRILRVIRIFRLFRINKYYDAFNVIRDVILEKKSQILSSVFIILMLIMASSLIMYNLEHDAQPDNFKNAFSGIWWAVSTLLTVGYGDIYPITNAGRFVGIILAFLGVGIVAIPTGIISAGFVEQYSKVKTLAVSGEEYPVHFISIKVGVDHPWAMCKVRDLRLVKGMILVAILRTHETIIPKGDTVIEPGDTVIIGAEALRDDVDIKLREVVIGEDHEWIGEKIKDLDIDEDMLIVLIKRGHKTIIPNGETRIGQNDTVLVFMNDKLHRTLI